MFVKQTVSDTQKYHLVEFRIIKYMTQLGLLETKEKYVANDRA